MQNETSELIKEKKGRRNTDPGDVSLHISSIGMLSYKTFYCLKTSWKCYCYGPSVLHLLYSCTAIITTSFPPGFSQYCQFAIFMVGYRGNNCRCHFLLWKCTRCTFIPVMMDSQWCGLNRNRKHSWNITSQWQTNKHLIFLQPIGIGIGGKWLLSSH